LFFVADTRDSDEKMEAYKQCLQQLPEVNHATLKHLVLHLSRLELFLYQQNISDCGIASASTRACWCRFRCL